MNSLYHLTTRKLITEATDLPVGVPETKLRCRIDHDAEDAVIEEYIRAGVRHFEESRARAVLSQTWDVYLPYFPCGDTIWLPLPPLQSVAAFEWTDSAGATSSWTVSGSNLLSGSTTMAHVDTISEPGRIVLAYSQSWPTATLKTLNPIRVRFVCGWTTSTVPSDFTQGLQMLAAHWYRNREAVLIGTGAAVSEKELPYATERMWANFKHVA